MPKIPQHLQDKMNAGGVDSAPRAGGRGPLNEGHYAIRLLEAEEGTKSTDGCNCKFEVSQGKRKGSWLWEFFSYSENSAWKLQQFFEAAGYTVDSDFEEMIEDEAEVVVYVTREIIEKGKKAGDWGNNVSEFLALDDDSQILIGETDSAAVSA